MLFNEVIDGGKDGIILGNKRLCFFVDYLFMMRFSSSIFDKKLTE